MSYEHDLIRRRPVKVLRRRIIDDPEKLAAVAEYLKGGNAAEVGRRFREKAGLPEIKNVTQMIISWTMAFRIAVRRGRPEAIHAARDLGILVEVEK